MAPRRKADLEKAAWAWCSEVDIEQITDEHIRSAYRLNAPKCLYLVCRRNCAHNPYCINGLGEDKWLADPVQELNDEDLDQECRKADSFVGLRNLGATCYINSLLQLWFHNIAFRNAILRWNPAEGAVDNVAISHLQFLFTLMQFGRKKSVDPSDFVSSLEIDVSQQQDAREFLQLFTAYLEDKLRGQSNPDVCNLVSNVFQGQYNYVTRCGNCRTESVRGSSFYELEVNIKGHKTLDESLTEFLKEENLTGDDKYLCCVCNSKQDATRHIELSHLPPVFNIQLIRFLYDREKGMKKKLNTPLQFPEKLNMSPFLNKNDENNVEKSEVTYNLFAVLIHKGTSANSGHYVAHICDQTSGNWYMFNDENTQKIEGKKLKLNSDEDYEAEEGGKRQRGGKAIKGYLCSSNAYMLVYTLSNNDMTKQKPIQESELQDHLKTKLVEYNASFESIISMTREEKRSQIEDENKMKAEMATLLPSLLVQEDKDWEAISVQWLSNWISSNKLQGFYRVDNSKFVCPHGKINPNAVKEFKYINKIAANDMYKKYGGGPRLDKDSLCYDCVRSVCELIQFQNKLAVDHKELTLLCKNKLVDTGFWVGKESIKNWKTKAFQVFDQLRNGDSKNCIKHISSPTRSLPDSTSSPSSTQNGHRNGDNHISVANTGAMNGTDDEHNELPCKRIKQEVEEKDNGFASKREEVNDDEHNDSPSKGIKQEVEEEDYGFASKREEVKEESIHEGGSEDGKLNNGNKTEDEEEQEEFDFLFNEDIVCPHGNLGVYETCRKLVPDLAWAILKCYFLDCKEFDAQTEPCLECSCLAYEGEIAKNVHKEQASKEKELLNNLYLGKNRPKEPYVGKYYVLSNNEFVEPWRKFIRDPGHHDPLTSLRNNKLICGHSKLKYNPNSPEDFISLVLVTEEEWEKISFIFMVDHVVSLEFKEDGGIVSSPEVCIECVEARIIAEQQALLQYTNAKVYIRQVTKSNQDDLSDSNSTTQVKAGAVEGPIRRSSRNKRHKDEKVFNISSDQTLMNLKLEIYNWLGVAPYDQHLLLGRGLELQGHDQTLSSLNVFPDSVLYLKVDEPGDESPAEESGRKKPKLEPEHGFKGTGLLKR